MKNCCSSGMENMHRISRANAGSSPANSGLVSTASAKFTGDQALRHAFWADALSGVPRGFTVLEPDLMKASRSHSCQTLARLHISVAWWLANLLQKSTKRRPQLLPRAPVDRACRDTAQGNSPSARELVCRSRHLVTLRLLVSWKGQDRGKAKAQSHRLMGKLDGGRPASEPSSPRRRVPSWQRVKAIGRRVWASDCLSAAIAVRW